jgi:hypothetical protein
VAIYDYSARKPALDAFDYPTKINGLIDDLSADMTTESTRLDSVKTKTDFLTVTQAVNLTTEQSKLATIETGATADQSDAEIKTAYENNANTNAFTDSLLSKLNGIEVAATADQSDGEIKTAYENNANTNAFTDSLLSKLNGIEVAATADQTGAEIKALYEVQANAYTDTLNTKLGALYLTMGGRCSTDGTLFAGSTGISNANISTGICRITHNLGHTNYSVTATSNLSATRVLVAVIGSNTFDVYGFGYNNTTATNTTFHFNLVDFN